MPVRRVRRTSPETSLNINSMMDMMTIILVFLLKSYSTSDFSVAPGAELVLPVSSAEKVPELAVNLVVAHDAIIVDGVEVVRLSPREDPDRPGQSTVGVAERDRHGQEIPALTEVLSAKADAAIANGELFGGEEHAFKGRVLVQADKRLPFEVLRQVIYTAGQARFGEFRFVVYKQG